MRIICAGIEWAVIDNDRLIFRGTRHECDQLTLRIKMGFTIDQAIEFVESRRPQPYEATWNDTALELTLSALVLIGMLAFTWWKAAL